MKIKLATLILAAACSLSLTACNNTEPIQPATPTSNVKPLPPVTGPPTIAPLPPTTNTPDYTPLTKTPPITPPASPQASPTPPVTPPPTPKPKTVALTFDDGPTPYSLQILEILKEENVPATFFQVGRQVKAHPEISRELQANGMSVQSHSWRHADLKTLSSKGIAEDISSTSKAITDATGVKPTCIRPPYGSVNSKVKNAINGEGSEVILWNVDSEDWKTPGSDKIASHTIETLQPQSIILMHDGVSNREQTVAALPRIIQKLKADGYTFIKLCEA